MVQIITQTVNIGSTIGSIHTHHYLSIGQINQHFAGIALYLQFIGQIKY